MSRAVREAPSPSRSATTTSAPSRANRSATARPMPRTLPAPVITTVLFFSFMKGTLPGESTNSMLAPALTSILLFGVLVSAQAPDRIPGHDAAKLQVLLVTGYNSTPRDDWRKNSAHLRRILEESGRC